MRKSMENQAQGQAPITSGGAYNGGGDVRSLYPGAPDRKPVTIVIEKLFDISDRAENLATRLENSTAAICRSIDVGKETPIEQSGVSELTGRLDELAARYARALDRVEDVIHRLEI